ncbi:hypothetical protein ACMFMG_005116 [Clarireedia jacksonii]
MVSVADLVSKLHDNIDEIHKTIAALSDTSGHDTEIDRLEKERDEKLEEIRKVHEESLRETVEAEKRREQEIEEQIRREEEEIMERRRKEDEDRKAKIESEVKERERARQEAEEKRRLDLETKQKGVAESAEEEIERLEEEMDRKIEEGKKTLIDLDARRKEINKQISEELERPTVLPMIQYRSKRKALQNNQQPDLSLINENKNVDVDGEKPDTSAARELDAYPDEVSDTALANGADEMVSKSALGLESGTTNHPAEPESANADEKEPQSQAFDPQASEQAETSAEVETKDTKTNETHEQEHVPESSFLGGQGQVEDAFQSAEHPVGKSHDETEAQPTAVDDATQRNIATEEVSEQPALSSTSTDDVSENLADNILQEAVPSTEPAQSSERDIIPEESEKQQELTSNHDSHESPEDRAAREEIEKLNEEIRKAMEKEENAHTVPDEPTAAVSEKSEEEATSTNTKEPVVADSAPISQSVEPQLVKNPGEEEAKQIAHEPAEDTTEARMEEGDTTSTEAVAENAGTSDIVHAPSNLEATGGEELTETKNMAHETAEPEKVNGVHVDEGDSIPAEKTSKDDTTDTAPVLAAHEAMSQAPGSGDEKLMDKSIDLDEFKTLNSQPEASDDTRDAVVAPTPAVSQSATVQPSIEQDATEKGEEPTAQGLTSTSHETQEVGEASTSTQNQEFEAGSKDVPVEVPETTNSEVTTKEPVQTDDDSLARDSELPDGAIIKPDLVQHVLAEANEIANQDDDAPENEATTEPGNSLQDEEGLKTLGKETLEANKLSGLDIGSGDGREALAQEETDENRTKPGPSSISEEASKINKDTPLGEVAATADIQKESVDEPEPTANKYPETISVSNSPAETADTQPPTEEDLVSSTEAPEPSTEEHAEVKKLSKPSHPSPKITETQNATEEKSPASNEHTQPAKNEELSDEPENVEDPAGAPKTIASKHVGANTPSDSVPETTATQIVLENNGLPSTQPSEPIVSGNVSDEAPTKEKESSSTAHTQPDADHHVEKTNTPQPADADTVSSHTESTTTSKHEQTKKEVAEPVSQTEILPTEENSTSTEKSDSNTNLPSGERANEKVVEAKSMEVVPDESAIGENEESPRESGEFEGESVEVRVEWEKEKDVEDVADSSKGQEERGGVEYQPASMIRKEISAEEDVASPGPQQFEGSGGARLTLDVWSPAASPSFQRDTQEDAEVEATQEKDSRETESLPEQESIPIAVDNSTVEKSPEGGAKVDVGNDVVHDEPELSTSKDVSGKEEKHEKPELSHAVGMTDVPTNVVKPEVTTKDSIDGEQTAHSVKPIPHIGNLIQEQYTNGAPQVMESVIDSEPHKPVETLETSLESAARERPPYEDPEDVRAREEIARLNDEFLKAMADEQAAEEARMVPTAVEEEQVRRGSHESADDIATREEIARLNKQIEEERREREARGGLDDNTSVPSIYSADHKKEDFETQVSSTVTKGDNALLQEDLSGMAGAPDMERRSETAIQDFSPNVPVPGHTSFLAEDSDMETEDDGEWDEESTDHDAHEYPYLETIQEEQSNNAVLAQQEQSDDEDLPKSRFFRQSVGLEGLVGSTSSRSLGTTASADAVYSGAGYGEDPTVPFLEVEHVEHKPVTPQQELEYNTLELQPTDRPQTPAMQMIQPDDGGEPPYTVDTPENLVDHNDSSDGGEEKKEPTMAAAEQQRVPTPETYKDLRPSNLRQRDGSLTPEHEAIFSRISQIRNRLSPEPPTNNNSMLNGGPDRYGEEQTGQDQSGARVINDSSANSYPLPSSDALAAEQPYKNALGAPIDLVDTRIRSDTVGTAPSFEHYADSEESHSGPATPPRHLQTVLPSLNPSLAPQIQSSDAWPRSTIHDEYTGSNALSDHNKTKAPQEEFDPFNPQAYKSPAHSPVRTQTSFHVTNVHVDQEYPPTSSSISQRSSIDSIARPKIHPPRNPISTDNPATQLPPNVRSIPWTTTSLDNPPKETPASPAKVKSLTPSTSTSSIFQKTRSLFESHAPTATSPSQGNGTETGNVSRRPRALSAIFGHNRDSSLSAPKAAVAQGASLQLEKEGAGRDEDKGKKDYDPDVDGEFVPRSLDGSSAFSGVRGMSLDGRGDSRVGVSGGGEGRSGSLDVNMVGKGYDVSAERGGDHAVGWNFPGLAGRGGRGVAEGEPLLGDGDEN